MQQSTLGAVGAASQEIGGLIAKIVRNFKTLNLIVSVAVQDGLSLSWPRGYKTFLMLNSAEHEIYPAHK